MFKYLGFPSPEEDDDVKTLLMKIDHDGSGCADCQEFKHFVEEFGGIDALFAKRRERVMAARTSEISSSKSFSQEDIKEELSACGIGPDAQAYWELVLPETELY